MFRQINKLGLVVLVVLSFGAAQAAIIDPALSARLAAAPSQLLSVVVTYNGQPAAADLALLRGAGVRFGVSLKELPMVGVWATSAQINQISAAPNVRSI